MAIFKRIEKAILKEGVTRPRWTILFLLFVILACSAASINFLHPFLPQMVKNFGYSEVDAGYYVGLIVSSFHIGRIFGSFLWGYFSDRFGRKIILIISLSLTSLSSLLFGFCTSVAFAVSVGFLSGFLNGAVIMGKSMLYEVSDNTNQSYGMSVLALSWGMGSLVGPLIGGLLSDSHIIQFQLSSEFQYLLPCMVIAGLVVITTIVSGVYLPETRKLSQSKEVQDPEVDSQLIPTILVTEPSFNGDLQTKSASETDLNVDQMSENEKTSESMNGFQSLPSLLQHRRRKSSLFEDKDERVKSLVFSSNVFLDAGYSVVDSKSLEPSRLRRMSVFVRTSGIFLITNDRNRLLLAFLYFMLSLAVVYQRNLVLVWATTDYYYGGLSFHPKEVATMLSSAAVCLIILQPMLFPALERKWGSLRTFIRVSVFILAPNIILPWTHYFRHMPVLFWAILLLMESVVTIAFITAFAALSLMLNNSVPSSLVGSMNGFGMACSSVGRVLGPVVSGSLFSISIDAGLPYPLDFNAAFLIGGVLIIAATVASLFLPERLNKQYVEDS